jgi:hypothetical protein
VRLGGVEIDGETAQSVAHRAGEQRRHCGWNLARVALRGWGGREGDGGFARGVLRVRTEEGKGDRGAAASCGPFLGGGG